MRSRITLTFILALVFSLSTYSAAAVVVAPVDRDEGADGQPGDLSIAMQPLISSASRRLTLVDKTYLDAHTILRASNSCSRFFGGPRLATTVLNFLYPRLQKTTLDEVAIGIIMSGPVTFGSDFQTGLSYRLFERVVINLKGPFFQSVDARSHGFFQRVGYFAANTREARVSMLLHELGHLLHDATGRWLLPDDSGNLVQIRANTNTIMERCGDQIKSLGQAP